MTDKQKAKQLALILVGEDQNPQPLIDVLLDMAHWQRTQMYKQAERNLHQKTNGEILLEDTVAFNEGFTIGKQTGAEEMKKQILDNLGEWCQGEFYIHPHDCHVVQYVSDKPLDNIDDFIEELKKEMEANND